MIFVWILKFYFVFFVWILKFYIILCHFPQFFEPFSVVSQNNFAALLRFYYWKSILFECQTDDFFFDLALESGIKCQIDDFFFDLALE